MQSETATKNVSATIGNIERAGLIASAMQRSAESAVLSNCRKPRSDQVSPSVFVGNPRVRDGGYRTALQEILRAIGGQRARIYHTITDENQSSPPAKLTRWLCQRE